MKTPNVIGKIAIIMFVLWHMFAIASYSIPRDDKGITATVLREKLLPVVTPYMFATSQWQLWNLFAPDPLRRITTYTIQTQEQNRWVDVATIEPGTYSILRHATRFKLYSNILNEFDDMRVQMGGRFLHLACAEHGISAGTPVRLTYNYYVIPDYNEPQSAAAWRQWNPAHHTNNGPVTTCPAS